jgi:hypothetical protein
LTDIPLMMSFVQWLYRWNDTSPRGTLTVTDGSHIANIALSYIPVLVPVANQKRVYW